MTFLSSLKNIHSSPYLFQFSVVANTSSAYKTKSTHINIETTILVLDLNSTGNHLFATPASAFEHTSTLFIDCMQFEQIIVETDVLSSWAMRLDDSCIMSRSEVELMKSENADREKSPESEKSVDRFEFVESKEMDEALEQAMVASLKRMEEIKGE